MVLQTRAPDASSITVPLDNTPAGVVGAVGTESAGEAAGAESTRGVAGVGAARLRGGELLLDPLVTELFGAAATGVVISGAAVSFALSLPVSTFCTGALAAGGGMGVSSFKRSKAPI
ncbi:MAG: hypothetical protein ACR2HK_13630 [Gemmatimonadales bacterium]